VVTAAEVGCTAILTENLANGKILHDVRLLNPFAGAGIAPDGQSLLTGD
jgi:predicted nucleic acid-binding protein